MESFMRVVVMFDIPTLTKEDRKHATKFRNNLLKEGFFMFQYSIYMRVVRGNTSANSAINRLKAILPPKGNIRAVVMTEKQFDNMQLLLGDNSEQLKKSKPNEPMLF